MDQEMTDASETLAELARLFFLKLDSKLPESEPDRKSLLLNLIRTIDFLTIQQASNNFEDSLIASNLVLLNGWNELLSKMLGQFSNGAIYNTEFTFDVYQSLLHLTHLYGRASTVKMVSDAVRFGECKAKLEDKTWRISRAKDISDPFISDRNEFTKSDALKKIFDESNEDINGWTIVNDTNEALKDIGSFHQRSQEFPGRSLYRDDLDERIACLVRPFIINSGTMTAYDASPETDAHFIAQAVELSHNWLGEAGLHPEAVVGGCKISEVLKITLLIVSLHLKHIHFCVVASKKYPEISLPQSLSIWTTRQELVESIFALSDENLTTELISKVLDIITLREGDAVNLYNHPRVFIPLLIDMGDGMLLRPVSSVARNPFETIKAMMHWRFPNATNLLAAPREDWLRTEIYGMFRGNRYFCVPGNVKLRSEGKILTDVDGAIFDVTTGELALLQLKWQDYSLANEKELRSRAKNLSSEMDVWAEKVYKWIHKSSVLDVAKSFKIPLNRSYPKSIYLFGVSRSVARTQGYGAIAEHGAVALCNLGQFSLARMEIGPVQSVLGAMHERLFSEMDALTNFQTLPTEFLAIDDFTINLPDFFYRLQPE